MEWPPQNTGLFAHKKKCCACAGPLIPSACTYDISYEQFAAPAETLEIAQTLIEERATCWFRYFMGDGDKTHTIDLSTEDELTISLSETPAPTSAGFRCVVAVAVDATVTVTWDVSHATSGVPLVVSLSSLAADGSISFLAEIVGTSTTGSGSFPPVAGGTYLIEGSSSSDVGDPSISATWTIAANDTMIPIPLVATYVDPDDAENALVVEACPRLELPLRGGVYADLEEAEEAMADYVVDCCAYVETANPGASSWSELTATAETGVVTGTLAHPGSGSLGALETEVVVARVLAAESFDVDFALGGAATGASQVEFELFNDALESVDTADGGAGNLSGTVNLTAPKAGRHFIVAYVTMAAPASAGNITLSLTFGADLLPAQMLYDRGLECPARLECEVEE
jgi:hypothetical protein